MTTAKTYHHGDLRDALVRAALEILEDSTVTEVSVRAAARRAGVSTGAPYRHFADRDAWRRWLLVDQRFVEGRPDVLTYTSEVLSAPVHIGGAPLVNLYASTVAEILAMQTRRH